MLLHFIFLLLKDDLDSRSKEFDYIQLMASFYKKWLNDKFGLEVDVKSDEMIVPEQSILQRLDTSLLIQDHKSRGKDIFHFYLCNFSPMWTDCTCEGYYAENFAMMLWQKPKNDELLETCKKNCTVVSHELTHEVLRQKKFKNQNDIVHDLWTRHLFKDLPFEQYGKNFEPNSNDTYFMTLDTTNLRS